MSILGDAGATTSLLRISVGIFFCRSSRARYSSRGASSSDGDNTSKLTCDFDISYCLYLLCCIISEILKFYCLFPCSPAHTPSNMATNMDDVTGVQVNSSLMGTESPRGYLDSPVPPTQPTPAQRFCEEQHASTPVKTPSGSPTGFEQDSSCLA